jgi:hypothetical protein
MHSYSAVPAAEAFRGMSRGERGDNTTAVLKMVYLSCNIPKAGDSHLSQMMKWMEEIGLSADLPVEASVCLNPSLSPVLKKRWLI